MAFSTSVSYKYTPSFLTTHTHLAVCTIFSMNTHTHLLWHIHQLHELRGYCHLNFLQLASPVFCLHQQIQHKISKSVDTTYKYNVLYMRALEAPYCLMQTKFTKFLQFHPHQSSSNANILTYHTVVFFRADSTKTALWWRSHYGSWFMKTFMVEIVINHANRHLKRTRADITAV